MSQKVINLKEVFDSTSFVTRQTAREIFDLISKARENEIALDFKDIQSATRSFFDELNSQQNKIMLLAKKVEFINLDSDLEKLRQLVINTSKVKSDVSYSSVANVDVITI